MRTNLLYHGSSIQKLDILKPSQSKDANNQRNNSLNAVYASDVKEIAITVSICKLCDTYGRVGLIDPKRPPYAILEGELPLDKEILLYTLKNEGFIRRPVASNQWISFQSITPLKSEILKVRNYAHLIKCIEKGTLDRKYLMEVDDFSF